MEILSNIWNILPGFLQVSLVLLLGGLLAWGFAYLVMQLNAYGKIGDVAALYTYLASYGVVLAFICGIPWVGFGQPLLWFIWLGAASFCAFTVLMFILVFIFFTWGDDFPLWLSQRWHNLTRSGA